MLTNNNKKIINQLSKANIKSSKMRNLFIGIVIVISVCMISVIASFTYNASYQVKNSTKFHGTFQGITDSKIEEIQNHKDLENIGVYRPAGAFKNNDYSLNVYYEDNTGLDLQQGQVISGNFPQKENEIALEKPFLDKHFGGKQVGDTVSVSLRNSVSKEMETKDFVISGILQFDSESSQPNKTNFEGLVSKEYIANDAHLKEEPNSILFRIKDYQSYNNETLKQKIKDVGAELGLSEKQVNINTYFIDSNLLAPTTVIAIVLFAFIILFACFLVIYNIFYISIINKVKEYGQLRTIGTTGAQIKKIIRKEGILLSLVYIPIGALLSLLITFFVPVQMHLAENLIITLVASLVVFLTVMFSVRKPGKLASQVSPIEATVYTPYRSDKKEKKSTKTLSPKTLAKMNLQRNKKKSILTFISLTITGILLIVSSTVMTSMDPALRAEYGFPHGGEYRVELNWNLVSPTTSVSDLQVNNPLTKELKENILAIDGVDSVVEVKNLYGKTKGSDNQEFNTQITSMDQTERDKTKAQLVAGDFNSTDLNSIIINEESLELKEYGLSYKLGDKITFLVKDGKQTKEMTFTVSAIFKDTDSGHSYFMNSDHMDTVLKESSNTDFEIISKQGYAREVETQLQNLIEGEERLIYQSLKSSIDDMRNAFKLMSTALYIIVGFIGCFGLVNLINTNVTNLITKKKELGVLEAVGMTRGQIGKMLFTESAYLTMGSFLVSIVFGTILSVFACTAIGSRPGMAYVVFRFPIAIILIYLAIVLAVQFLLTYSAKKMLAEQTVTERLREN